MARSISKSLASATVYVFDPSIAFELDENGNPKPNREFKIDGNPSLNAARIKAQKLYGRNILVTDVQVDETKLTVSPTDFLMHSSVCLDGESYGREFVTQTFKITTYRGWYMSEDGMTAFENEYVGETTQSKLQTHAIASTGTKNTVITDVTVREERRFMSRDKYMELAK